MTPATFWVKLEELDLQPGAPVKKLTLTGRKTYSGDATGKLVETKLFNVASLDAKFENPQK
jgi:choloylglycine hydrolase